jgi:DNA-binding protein H-NS
MTLKPEKLEM